MVRSLSEIYCAPSKVFYTNGIKNWPNDADEVGRQLWEMNGRKIGVEVIYNDSTTLGNTVKGATRATFAVLAQPIAWVAGKKIPQGVHAFTEVQDRKNELARNLAYKIFQYLENNHLGKVTLVSHSQGSHIHLLALCILNCCTPHLMDRINVITMGGTVDIPEELARGRVVNYQLKGDKVSEIFQVVVNYNDVENSVILRSRPCGPFSCHKVELYLNHPVIAAAIRNFSEPDCYVRTL